MKKQLSVLLLAISLFLGLFYSCGGSVKKKEKEVQEVITPVHFGDPFVLLHGDTYYAYGTASENGIQVYTSDDLLRWALQEQLALNKEDVWADKWFWAPEVYEVGGKFYMYYSADERICVATSDSPLGPFVQEVKKPMIADEQCIDNSLFIDEDGKAYMYYDRFNDGLNIWVAELEENLTEIKEGTMHKCINVSQEWEEVQARVNEGPYVLKHEEVYYMTYSANHYQSQSYGIGYATASSPNGPWTKYEGNPIYQKVGGLVGIGHSAMFTDKDGKLRTTFHAHNSPTEVHQRIMHISDVSFEKKDGETVMAISPDFITPEVAK